MAQDCSFAPAALRDTDSVAIATRWRHAGGARRAHGRCIGVALLSRCGRIPGKTPRHAPLSPLHTTRDKSLPQRGASMNTRVRGNDSNRSTMSLIWWNPSSLPQGRHAELVSASIFPQATPSLAARWTLKRVQGDDSGNVTNTSSR